MRSIAGPRSICCVNCPSIHGSSGKENHGAAADPQPALADAGRVQRSWHHSPVHGHPPAVIDRRRFLTVASWRSQRCRPSAARQRPEPHPPDLLTACPRLCRLHGWPVDKSGQVCLCCARTQHRLMPPKKAMPRPVRVVSPAAAWSHCFCDATDTSGAAFRAMVVRRPA